MGHYNLLIICYCIIFTAFNFGAFLTCYLFGFTYDRDLRKNDNRVFLTPFARFFFYFKEFKAAQGHGRQSFAAEPRYLPFYIS